MFELKYAITANDIKAENKKLALFYFLLYFCVAVIGLAVGIVAVVINPQTSIFVIGIIILVFSALLAAVALFMLIAPKNLISSVIGTDDNELAVVIDKNGITVNGDNIAAFADITKIKDRKTYLVVYTDKDKAFIVKDSITSGQAFDELTAYMTERQGKLLLVPTSEQAEQPATETEGENKD
ncbi:MAG: hypothetical protein K2M47_05770 [Clostridiales bacterium]|nr:hypothetical protein [Clostridiales bacterium]